MIIAKAKIGKDFRLTIPKEVRGYLKLEGGEELIFYVVEGLEGRVCIRRGS
ncbi:MAG TPA: AbrB/MazE/SpoVT family DNA-binding domain-containing protein [Candidatus Bathyarchaeota archaeon]|nr:AbrB/MazE/SpoVT family DNA-binding domain-containing protein [Candidatus Bathyarchaeota archaeon]